MRNVGESDSLLVWDSAAYEELSVRATIALNQKRAMQRVINGDDDEEEDEEFENEFMALSAQVVRTERFSMGSTNGSLQDKVTLKMFAAAFNANKVERALDLVERLHLEQSFDLAMQIADSNRKLVDRVEEAKQNKFGDSDDLDDGVDGDDDSEMDIPTSATDTRNRISPDASMGRKRTGSTFDDRRVRQKSALA